MFHLYRKGNPLNPIKQGFKKLKPFPEWSSQQGAHSVDPQDLRSHCWKAPKICSSSCVSRFTVCEALRSGICIEVTDLGTAQRKLTEDLFPIWQLPVISSKTDHLDAMKHICCGNNLIIKIKLSSNLTSPHFWFHTFSRLHCLLLYHKDLFPVFPHFKNILLEVSTFKKESDKQETGEMTFKIPPYLCCQHYVAAVSFQASTLLLLVKCVSTKIKPDVLMSEVPFSLDWGTTSSQLACYVRVKWFNLGWITTCNLWDWAITTHTPNYCRWLPVRLVEVRTSSLWLWSSVHRSGIYSFPL